MEAVVRNGRSGIDWHVGKEEDRRGERQETGAAEELGFGGAESEFENLETAGWGRGFLNDAEVGGVEDCGEEEAQVDAVDSRVVVGVGGVAVKCSAMEEEFEILQSTG